MRECNGNKAYRMIFLCNPYHQLSAIKVLLVSLLFFTFEYIFLKQFLKIIDGKIYLLTYTFL